jgi:nucleoid-associated protein YgaU
VGMRSTLAPSRTTGVRDARELRLPPIAPDDEHAGASARRYGTMSAWGMDEDAADAEEFSAEQEYTPFRRYGVPPTRMRTGAYPVPSSATLAEPQPALGRVRRATQRLAELGAYRPMVRIPGAAARDEQHGTPHHAKLPPIWLLANLVIMLAVGIAVLPQVVHVDAAAGCEWYTVRPGDTLGNLGWAHHTNAMAIANANHIANPNLIFVGQHICIPLTSWAQAHSAPAMPAAAMPPRFGTASGVQSFITFALPYARQAHQATGWPVSMILAQWGLEQGWRIPGYTGYNWGNVASLPGAPTVGGINVPGSPARFTYASTPAAGLNYYLRVAGLSYYRGVATAARKGADAAARALGASPWDAAHYTNIGQPGSSLIRIMRVYNLYWYDTH